MENQDCTKPGCGCDPFNRREFLRIAALATGAAVSSLPMMAGPFNPAEFEKLVPADKKLDPGWVKSLFEKGTPATYHWPQSEKIGMPIGGICTGQLYLGGDGKLWHWDIFNKHVGTGAELYARPLKPTSPLDQGFALLVAQKGAKTQVRALDHTGWADVVFRGEYPIGRVDYQDSACPAQVRLEAFSPFIPLNVKDSALPATVMRFTITNTGQEELQLELAGWLENAVCLHSARSSAGLRRNRIVRRGALTFLACSAEAQPPPSRKEIRADILFDDFERAFYERWEVTGTAFGSGPVEEAKMPEYQGKVEGQGQRVVNSHASAPGKNVAEKDTATGTLASRPFLIERDYITFLIGGGSHERRTCVNLLVDDQVVLSATGRSDNRMGPHSWDVRPWAGRSGRLQVIDEEKGAWGNISVDDIVFSDTPRVPLIPLERQADFGTMGLGLLEGTENGTEFTRAVTLLPDGHVPAGVFNTGSQGTGGPATKSFGQKLAGSLTRKLSLKAGQSGTVTFLLTWHFPNLAIGGMGDHQGRQYGKQFPHALAIAEYVAANFDRLASETKLWRDTWYDSTLPWWFLDRTFATTSHLATSTCYWLGNGRFYGWEGVGCCAGTCTHVWHYAHAMGRLFPQLERSLREMVDFGVGFEDGTGRIRFRAEHNNHWAVDGQAGCILRTYREHQVSTNDGFLRRVWPKVKKSMEFLMRQDKGSDGILDGPQHNTLDADWHGQVAWLSGLYLAALRAGEEMAREVGDTEFAQQCRSIFEKGRVLVDEQLFNGEYYVHLSDPAHRKTVGSYDGCEIDQVFGDSWAGQVALGRILSEKNVRTALRSLWRYNFTPDVGPYRNAFKPGRWYAMAGEGGLLMCTWPKGEAQRVKESFDYYFNECMTGFEYQVAWHMMSEGMLQEALAVTRAIHDRYHPKRRNPWNEVECGDHYARAMASYGVFLAACGFEYHGPKGHIGFAPRLQPDNFKAAFTAAEGWGTYEQRLEAGKFECALTLRWGKLQLSSLSFVRAEGFGDTDACRVTLAGKTVDAKMGSKGERAIVRFGSPLTLEAGQKLEIVVP